MNKWDYIIDIMSLLSLIVGFSALWVAIKIYRMTEKSDNKRHIEIKNAIEHIPITAHASEQEDITIQRLRNPQTSQDYFLCGYAAYLFDNYKEAIRNYEKAIELEPDADGTYYNLGGIYYYHNKNKKKGLEYIQKAATLGSSEAQKWLTKRNLMW